MSNSLSGQKVIPINTNKNKFFLEYLRLYRPVIESILTKMCEEDIVLRNKELLVMASILFYYDKYGTLNDNDKYKLIFNYETRAEMRTDIGISEAYFNNSLTDLRRKKALLDGDRINPIFLPRLNGGSFELTFRFKINEIT